jgi:hypothetical protein
VAYLPHVGAVEVQKPRGTLSRNSSGVLLSRALPPLPLALHSALLDYAVKTGSRNSEGSHTTKHNAAFSRMSDSSVHRRD